MKYIVAIGIVVSFLTSCTFYEPEMRGGENFKLEKMEGKEVKFSAGAKVYNGNWFALKVKPSVLDLYIDDKYMGKVYLLKKIKMKGKSETEVEGDFLAELEGNAMLKALGLALKGEVDVRLTGKIKGGVFFISKKFDYDETKTVNTRTLRGK